MKRLKVFMFLVLLLAPCSSFASRHRHSTSVLAARPQSVPLENLYADRLNLVRFQKDTDIRQAIQQGVLQPLTTTCAPSLPTGRRYALPATVQFMAELDSWFTMNTGHRLIVDSAVRSVETQRKIRRWNRNAAPATGDYPSSHERGTTVDLSRRMSKAEHQFLIIRLLYYRALGRILVIEERRCIHIFVIGDYDGFPRVGLGTVRDDEGGSIEPRSLYPVQGTGAPEVLDGGREEGIPYIWPL